MSVEKNVIQSVLVTKIPEEVSAEEQLEGFGENKNA